MKNIIIILLILIGFIFPQDCEEPTDVWFKISTDVDSNTYGEIIKLDMSKGYASSDDKYIYIIVLTKDTKRKLILSFPIGFWVVENINGFKKNEKEEFDLDEYLKKNKGKGKTINTNITKVGE